MNNINLTIIGKERILTDFKLDVTKYFSFNDVDITSGLINDLANQIEENDEFLTLYGTEGNINITKDGFEEIIIYDTKTHQQTYKIITRIDYEDLI